MKVKRRLRRKVKHVWELVLKSEEVLFLLQNDVSLSLYLCQLKSVGRERAFSCRHSSTRIGDGRMHRERRVRKVGTS